MPGDRELIDILRLPNRVVFKIQHSVPLDPINLLIYRQWTQWHELIIAGPATNCAGSQGNSFPGIYCYNPATKTQWVVMAEGPIDWRECRLGVSPRDGALELGLFSTGEIDPQVSLQVWHSKINDLPTQWNAMETLIAKSFALIPLPRRPDFIPDRMKLASQCVAGLSSEDWQHPLAKQLGGVAYHSMLVNWFKSMYARPKPYIELIPQVSIARALHRATQNTLIEDVTYISRKLVERVIPHFFNPELGVFENNYSGGRMRTRQKRNRRPKISDRAGACTLGLALQHQPHKFSVRLNLIISRRPNQGLNSRVAHFLSYDANGRRLSWSTRMNDLRG